MIENTDFITKSPVDGSYNVTYGLYRDEEKYPWNSIKNPYINTKVTEIEYEPNVDVARNHACFSNLGSKLNNTKGYNRIIYYFKPYKILTNEEQLRWLLLAKQYKLLPRYVNIKKVIEKHNVVFDVSKGDINLLYMYLTMVRMLEEEPAYVKNSLVLIDKYKIDYFVALVGASYFCFRNFGHSFFNPGNTYPSLDKPASLNRLKLKTVLGLYKFVNRKVKNESKKDKHFSATNTVSNLSNAKEFLNINKCIGLNIDSMLQTSNDVAAAKEFNKLWGENVKK